jgi:hypothetical protein
VETTAGYMLGFIKGDTHGINRLLDLGRMIERVPEPVPQNYGVPETQEEENARS